MNLNPSEHTFIVVDNDGSIESINDPLLILPTNNHDPLWSSYFIKTFSHIPGSMYYSVCNGNSVQIYIFFDANNNQIIFISDVTKIIDLKGAESKHNRLNAMMEMSGSISHQIKTPLSNALLQLELLKSEIDNDRVCRVIDSINNIDSLLNEMFIFSKSKSNGVSPISSKNIIDILSSNFISMTEINYSGADINFIGNEILIVSALTNLVKNSIDANPQTEINISTSLIKGYCVFSYVDTSGGLNKKINGSSTGGWGIGMSVTKFIIEAHGGSINYKNTDDGLNIIITIPSERSVDNG